MTLVKSYLYQVRHKKGLTLEGLALISGISKSEINNIENNMVSPRLDTLYHLAKALNCSITDLFEDVK